MPSGTRQASALPTGAPATARDWAAEVREEARRLREQSAATRALLAARRATHRGAVHPTTGEPSGEWRSRLAAAEDRAAQLERALVSNRRIGIAIGVLMARLQLTDVAAFELLRRISQHRNVKLRELAEEVIYTGSL
jgi:ANTAR domain